MYIKKMLKLTALLALMVSYSFGQSNGNFQRITVRDSVWLNGKWIKNISSDSALGSGDPGILPNQAAIKGALNGLSARFLHKKQSRIFPYDSGYFVPPRVAGASDIEIINFGNTAHLDYPIYQNPMALWANNWAMGFGVNVQYDSVAKRYKVFNPDYPVSYYEAGWEGVTLHTIPANQADTVDKYPHEPFQVRPGLDGATLIDPSGQYVQIKAPLAARYDTSFDVGETAYGWGWPKRLFQWYFSEGPTVQGEGNEFSSYDQYTSSATAGAKFSFKRSRGNYNTKQSVLSGDTLGGLSWFAHDGSKWLETGRMYAKASANATTGNAATDVILKASNGGASTGSMTLTSTGNVGLNTNAPLSVLHLVKEGIGGVVYLDRYSAGGGLLPPSIYGIASNGTTAFPLAIKKNDPLIVLAGGGYDGASLDRTSRGSVSISADNDWSGSNKSTRFDLFLTNVVNDSRRVFSVDHNGRGALADTTDPAAKFYVDGNVKALAPGYSSGGYSLLVRNTTTGLFESVPSSNFVQNMPGTRQVGNFDLNSSSSIVSSGTAALSIGQTSNTPTNQAVVLLDGVNGDFIGADYMRLGQFQTGESVLQNVHPSQTLTLGAGGAGSSNIVLAPSNLVRLGGAVDFQVLVTSGSLTLASQTIVRVTNASHVITLPAASACQGRVYSIQNYNTGGGVTISSVLVYGTPTTTIPNNTEWTVYSDGTSWVLKSRSN